jgi:hypothetical protein
MCRQFPYGGKAKTAGTSQNNCPGPGKLFAIKFQLDVFQVIVEYI